MLADPFELVPVKLNIGCNHCCAAGNVAASAGLLRIATLRILGIGLTLYFPNSVKHNVTHSCLIYFENSGYLHLTQRGDFIQGSNFQSNLHAQFYPSSIARTLCMRTPFTIFFAIVSEIVDAIQNHSFWWISHIF